MAVRGLLIDLEGVLYQDGRAIAGAVETLAALAARGVDYRFLTNTTTKPRSAIVASMTEMGFAVEPVAVFTPAIAAARFLQGRGVRRIHLAAPEGLGEDFADFERVDEAPEAVVMGDLHEGFTWRRLDGLFRMVQSGALLVTLHKNRYCRRDGDLSLDLSPFAAALEYAGRTTAAVMGKPDAAFFALAVETMGLEPADVMMVGDDMDADIGGGLAAGLEAVQVRTGKFDPGDPDRDAPQPGARIDSIREIVALLG